MNDESVRKFQARVGEAVTRGRRARAEVRERSETFRRHTKELSGRLGDRSHSDDDSGPNPAAEPGDGSADTPEESQQQTLSAADHRDVSQPRTLP